MFIGGYIGRPCPPNADCVVPENSTASDGAAYNSDAGTWQPIADAPVPVLAYSPTAVLNDTLYVLTNGRLISWEASDNDWTSLEPPNRPTWATLVADGNRLILASGSDENGIRPDQTYNPRTNTWSQLPANPLRPSFDRVITATSAGLVLTAKPIAPDGGPEDPALVNAALLAPGADTWQPLTDNDNQLGGWHWTWTGARLVDPTPGGADGGEVNGFGRTIPYGGTLDPTAGTWGTLDGTPKEFTDGWPVEAIGGRHNAVQGWIYDDGNGGEGSSWTTLDRPEDAPEEPGTAVWVDDALIVAGGADWVGPSEPDEWTPANVWSVGAWAYQAG